MAGALWDGCITMFSEGMSGGRGFMGVAAMFFGEQYLLKHGLLRSYSAFACVGCRAAVFGLPQFPLMLPYVTGGSIGG